MLPPAFSSAPESNEARNFEQLLHDGIEAVKSGNRSHAKSLLEQAALINSADARVWIWLSGTTDDLQERRSYLENAVATDPSNEIAKRGLVLISKQLGKAGLTDESAAAYSETAPREEGAVAYSKTAPQDEGVVAYPEATPQDVGVVLSSEAAPRDEGEVFISETTPPHAKAVSKTYTCPNCGASISYEIHDAHLVCQFCGFTRKVDDHIADESTNQVPGAALPTTSTHRWAEGQARFTCEQCGVIVLVPLGQTAESCPNCASNRFVSTPGLMEMVDPQMIGLFKLDPDKAAKSIKTWLGKGLLAPDDLVVRHAGMQLHPAYYPFWLFTGTLEIPWFCDVNVSSGKTTQWQAHSGIQFETVKEILIPGLRKISHQDLAEIEPFNLDGLAEFSPDFLSGWVTLAYDYPMVDASLRARDRIIKEVQHSMSNTVEPNRPKRNFKIGAGKWNDLTSRLVLLPIYIGNYPFQGKRYRLLVNGQTGKVSGKKPIDTLKAVMFSIAGLVLLVIIIVIFSLLRNFLTG